VLEKVIQLKNLNKATYLQNLALRQANEIATFILFFVVFTVILKYALLEYWWQLALGFVGLVIFITLVVKLLTAKESNK
jgi:putative membrane protein